MARVVRKSQPWVEGIFWLIIGLIGLFLMAHFGTRVIQGYATNAWESTTGRVIASEVIRKNHGQRWDGRGKNRVSIHNFLYTYEVAGEEFQSNHVRAPHSNVYSWHSNATKQAQRYREGAPVKVYYQPDDPANSVLETGIQFSPALYSIIGIIMLIGASFLAIVRRKKWCCF